MSYNPGGGKKVFLVPESSCLEALSSLPGSPRYYWQTVIWQTRNSSDENTRLLHEAATRDDNPRFFCAMWSGSGQPRWSSCASGASVLQSTPAWEAPLRSLGENPPLQGSSLITFSSAERLFAWAPAEPARALHPLPPLPRPLNTRRLHFPI